MRYTVSTDMHDRLVELAELLRACREAFLRISHDHHWKPAETSLAAADLAAFNKVSDIRDDGIVLETVAAYLELAAGNCGGLAGLYETDEVLTSPPQLARSILEDCARACWLLGSNPASQPALDRLARTYIDHDLSAVDKKTTAQRLAGKTSPGYLAAKREFNELRAEIQAVFPSTVGTDFNRPAILNGQRCLGLTDTAKWFFALLHDNGAATVDSQAGEGIYIRLCNQTHPTISAIRERRRFIAHGEHFGTKLVVTQAEIETLTRLAVSCIYNTLAWVHQYCGWDFDPDHEFENRIDATTPGLFSSVD
ncbi:hypothetical protein ACQP2U_42510 (plasmid) [Nocardia sp. CA-084685]|uniref:hypothetical protein n=1 Tax=Nocardia sp. CA-084685 TaxID=3239970 RepID=UPI003D966A08